MAGPSQEDRAHADRVRHIQEWEAAYRDAHDGAEPPAGFMPPMHASAPSSHPGTNALAVLSLVFAFLGGLLAIPFGHIALFQIKRSGERGRGMAITGLILGYIWLITLSIAIGVYLDTTRYS